MRRSTPGRVPNGRSGNHRGEGILIACGPGIPQGRSLAGRPHIRDLAPTVLARLGVGCATPLSGIPVKIWSYRHERCNSIRSPCRRMPSMTECKLPKSGSGIEISSPYQWRYFLKRIFFHKSLFGPTIDHAIIRAVDTCVRILRRDPGRLFSSVEIETINRCNSTCSFCPVNRLRRPASTVSMSDDLFTRILDDLGSLGYSGKLALHSNNEPLLDESSSSVCALPGARVPPPISLYTPTAPASTPTRLAAHRGRHRSHSCRQLQRPTQAAPEHPAARPGF